MRRLLPLAAALLVVATACGGTSKADAAASKRRDQIRKAATDAGLPRDVADFLSTAAGVVGESFQVTYDLADGKGGTAVLSQHPPRRRVDLRTTVKGTDAIRSLITDGGQSTVCQKTAGTWSCRPGSADESSPGGFGEQQIDNAVKELKQAKGDYDFRLGTRSIAGQKARCLVTELKPGRQEKPGIGRKGTLCVSSQGVPLLVETPIASLRALKYADHVDDKVFDIPAKVER